MKKYFCTVIIIVLLIIHVQAQTGQLTGKVIDQKTNESLVGATVRLEGTDQGSVTDINGRFLIKDIDPNTYNVTASFIGYTTLTQFNVEVRSQGNRDINFSMSEDAEQLGEVIVVASAFEKMEETPLSIQRLGPEEITSYPGANNDIAKVVQSLPGVSNSVGGFRNDVIIRGGAPNENVYFLDGVEIPTINHFSTQGSAGGPIGLLNVSFFEGVRLSTSAFPAQYDNVLSGILQFDQRNGNSRGFQGNVRVSSSEAALTLEGPLFKKEKEESSTTFIASARRSYTQLISDLAGLPFTPDFWDYQFKINHQLNDYNSIMLTGVGSIDDFAVNELDEFEPELQAIQDQVPVIQQRTNTIGATWKRRFKDQSGFLQTTFSSNVLDNVFSQYADNLNETGLYFQNDATERQENLRFQLTKFLNEWTISYGFNVRNNHYENNTTDLVNDLNFNSSIDFFSYGLFGQFSRRWLEDRLGFSAGIRADGNSFTVDGNDIYRTLSPRLSFSYQLSEGGKWTANASVGRYYKTPPLTILGFRNNSGLLVNENANYIQSDHLVAGLEYLINSSSRFSVEGFLKLYNDYPVSVLDSVSLANKGGGFEVLGSEEIVSDGRGRTYGVEFLYQQQFTGNYYAIAAVTLYKSEFTGFDIDDFAPSTWDNGVLVSLTGGYKFGNNWEVSGRLRVSGPAPYTPINEGATLANYPAIIRDYSRLGEAELETFTQLDIRISKKWNFKAFSLDVFLDVQNALASTLPAEPQYGLRRDDQGQVEQPQQLVVANTNSTGTPLPSLGLVINF